jgi:hypothetical protein
MLAASADTSRSGPRFLERQAGAAARLGALCAAVAVLAGGMFGASAASARPDRGDARLADVTATITPGGDPVTVTTTNAGDNVRVTFTGAVDQRVFLKVVMSMSAGAAETVDLLDPNGQRIGGTGVIGNGTRFIDTKKLLVAGTYTIFIDPLGSATGSNTLTLYDVPPDRPGRSFPAARRRPRRRRRRARTGG